MDNEHLFTLFTEISEDLDVHLDLITTLYTAQTNETVTILIDSIGGCVSSAVAIVQAIEQSRATVHCNVIGDCHSAATFIFLAAPHKISPHSLMLFHDFHMGVSGNHDEIVIHLSAERERYSALFERLCGNIITQEESDSIFHLKQDLILQGQDVTDRIEKTLTINPTTP